MAFVAIEDLSVPSRIAIFKLCFGNIIFLILGVAATSLGLYYLQPESILRFIGGYIRGARLEELKALLDDNTTQIVISCCIILLAAGIGVIIVSCVGFCGAVTRNPHCMVGYVTFLAVLVIAEAVGLALFGTFKSQLDTKLQDYMKNGILSREYKSGHGTASGITTMFDVIQMEYECCGVSGGGDFASEKGSFKNWRRSFPYNHTDRTAYELNLPVFCCKFRNKKLAWTQVVEFNRNRNLTFTTLETTIGPYLLHEECLDPDIQPNSRNTWYNKGCYKSFQVKVFNALFRVLVGIILTILVFEILCLLASCMLICDIRSAQSLLEKKEEKEAALRAERDTILQGLQMTGSMAALGMTGSLATMSAMNRTRSMMGPSANNIQQGIYPTYSSQAYPVYY